MKGCRESDLDMGKLYYYNYFMDQDCYFFPNLIEHFETSNAIKRVRLMTLLYIYNLIL